jgi:hypothetical protein
MSRQDFQQAPRGPLGAPTSHFRAPEGGRRAEAARGTEIVERRPGLRGAVAIPGVWP